MIINESVNAVSESIDALYGSGLPTHYIINESVSMNPAYTAYMPLLEAQSSILTSLGEVRGKLLKKTTNIDWKGFVESIKKALSNIASWIRGGARTVADLITGRQTILGLIKRLREKKAEAKAAKNTEAEKTIDDAIKGADNVVNLAEERIKRAGGEVKPADTTEKGESARVINYDSNHKRRKEIQEKFDDLHAMYGYLEGFSNEIDGSHVTESALRSFKVPTNILYHINTTKSLIYTTLRTVRDVDTILSSDDKYTSFNDVHDNCSKRYYQITDLMPGVRLAIKVSKSQKK